MNGKTHRKVVREALNYMWYNLNAEPIMKSAIRLLVWVVSKDLHHGKPLSMGVNGTHISLLQGICPQSPQSVFEYIRDAVSGASADIDYIDDTWIDTGLVGFLFIDDQDDAHMGIQAYKIDSNYVTSLNHFYNALCPGEFNQEQHDGYSYKHAYYRDEGVCPTSDDWEDGIWEWLTGDGLFSTVKNWNQWSNDLKLAYWCDVGDVGVYRPSSVTIDRYR